MHKEIVLLPHQVEMSTPGVLERGQPGLAFWNLTSADLTDH